MKHSGGIPRTKAVVSVLLMVVLMSGCGAGSSSNIVSVDSGLTESSEVSDYTSAGISSQAILSIPSVLSSKTQSKTSLATTTSRATSSAPIVTSSVNEVVRVSVWTPSLGTGNELVDMGLGENETAHVSLNRDYEWYIDQFTTGEYGRANCGPTCVAMAAKWYNKEFATPAEEIRSLINTHQNNWGIIALYPKEIKYCLEYYSVPFSYKSGVSADAVLSELQSGNIMIVLLKMMDITFEPNVNYHVNKFVYWDQSHYFIIKGYRVVDEKLWFEVYDPYSRDVRYTNKQLKGKDRYYLAEEVITSIQKSGDNYFVIGGKPTVSGSPSIPLSSVVSATSPS